MKSIAFHTIPVLVLATVLTGFAKPVRAEIFEGVPDVIVCEVELPQQDRVGRMVFYLDAQEQGRVTRYTSLGAAPMQIRVGPDGTVDQGNLGDCSGKTVSELRNADQAFDVE